ncbi:hypothetical protein [Nocardia sp. NPDC056000]|uniref:hypothetical protein n=1 Tax=Nocardia sp. NPDC056000 TaxID=3345674 RepID=UPI0035D712E2
MHSVKQEERQGRVAGPIGVLYDELNLLRADLEAEHRKPTPAEIERVRSIYSQASVLWEERQRATSGGVFRIPTPDVRSASGTQEPRDRFRKAFAGSGFHVLVVDCCTERQRLLRVATTAYRRHSLIDKIVH